MEFFILQGVGDLVGERLAAQPLDAQGLLLDGRGSLLGGSLARGTALGSHGE